MKKEFKIGAFVVIILVVSFVVLNYLRGKDILNKEIEIVSTYENLEGLMVSAPVYVQGYKVGKVSDIIYDAEKEFFTVVCSIKKEFRIPSDSKMTIYSVDLMGGKGIKLEKGTSSEYLKDGDYLDPSFEYGLVDGLAANITPLIDKLTISLENVNATVAIFNELLSNDNKDHINKTLLHVENMMSDLKGISSVIDNRSDELDSFVADLSVLSSSLVEMVEQADSTIKGVNKVVNELDSSEIVDLVNSFNDVLNSINDPNGSLGKFLTEDSIYNSVDELLLDIQKIVDKIQENPKKFFKISVF